MVDEAPREALPALLERDPVMLVWWVRRSSAFGNRPSRARGRDCLRGRPPRPSARALAGEWQEVLPSSRFVRTRSGCSVHPLGGRQLAAAAAIVAAEATRRRSNSVGLDDRLNDAAAREGLSRRAR
jgi:hypothetical protein